MQFYYPITERKCSYNQEVKIKTVEFRQIKGSLQQVVQEFDISPKNLCRWKQEYQSGQLNGSSRGIEPESAMELENIAFEKSITGSRVSA